MSEKDEKIQKHIDAARAEYEFERQINIPDKIEIINSEILSIQTRLDDLEEEKFEQEKQILNLKKHIKQTHLICLVCSFVLGFLLFSL